MAGRVAACALALAAGLALLGDGRPAESAAPPAGGPGKVDLYGDPLPPGALARLGSLRFRPGSTVGRLSFSPDGKKLIADLAVFDAREGRLLGRLAQPRLKVPPRKYAVRAWALSPCGKALAESGEDRLIRLYDTRTWQLRHTLAGHELAVWVLAFSPDGTTLASGEGWDERIKDEDHNRTDRVIRLWDVRTGKQLHVLRGDRARAVGRMEFSPDGKVLAARVTWGLDLWDVATGKLLRRVGERVAVTGGTFSPDGKLLATGGDREPAHVWEAGTGRKVLTLEGSRYCRRDLVFSPDGKVLAGTWVDGATLCLWDAKTGKRLPGPPGHLGPVRALAASPDGKTALTAGKDRTVRLWELASGRELCRLEGPPGQVYQLAFSPDGKSALGLTGLEPDTHFDDPPGRAVWLWDVATGKRRSLPGGLGPFLPRSVEPHLLGRSSLLLLGPSRKPMVRLWDVREGKELAAWELPPRAWGPRALSPDGKVLALTSWQGRLPEEGQTLRLLAASSGKELAQVVLGPNNGVTGVAFSPDGRLLAIGDARAGVVLRDARSLRELLTIPRGKEHLSVRSFSPDGRLLLGQRTERERSPGACVWEIATGREVCFLRGPRQEGWQPSVNRALFTPEGLRVVTASNDSTALVWGLPEALSLRRGPLGSGGLSSLWADLRSPDAAAGLRAGLRLAAAPAEAVPWLGKRLRPEPVRDPKRARGLVAALGSPEFAERERAARELGELGELAEPELREALRRPASVEVARQVKRLLEGLGAGPLRGEELAKARAVQALEHIGTEEARAVLRALAKGEPLALLTRGAKESLQRLERRDQG
jgi:WD40 repeat protein